jgi:hypothetical protein
MAKKHKRFEIFTRVDRIKDEKVSTGIIIEAEDKEHACDKYCNSNNNVWVSAKQVK